MTESVPGEIRLAPSDSSQDEPDDLAHAPSITVTPSARERIQRLGNGLRWGEALWIHKQRPLKGVVAAFHDTACADETRVPCFMLPSLPQLSTDFIELAAMMDASQPFFGLYLPSAKRRPETGSAVCTLAGYYADEIDKLWPTGPLCIGGWSAGATVALVVAQIMRSRGRDVPLLIVIDGAPPSVEVGRISPTEKASLTYHRLANVGKTLLALAGDIVRRVRHRTPQNPTVRDAIRLAWRNAPFRLIWERATSPLLSVGSRLNERAPPRHPAEIASNIAGVPADHRDFAKALYDAVCNYLPEPYPGNTLVFESTLEPARSSEKVAKRWRRIAEHAEIVAIAGSHMSIVVHPDGLPLARVLSQRLRDISLQQPNALPPEPCGEPLLPATAGRGGGQGGAQAATN